MKFEAKQSVHTLKEHQSIPTEKKHKSSAHYSRGRLSVYAAS